MGLVTRAGLVSSMGSGQFFKEEDEEDEGRVCVVRKEEACEAGQHE